MLDPDYGPGIDSEAPHETFCLFFEYVDYDQPRLRYYCRAAWFKAILYRMIRCRSAINPSSTSFGCCTSPAAGKGKKGSSKRGTIAFAI